MKHEKIKLSKLSVNSLIDLHKTSGILLEGNILDAIDQEGLSPEALVYIERAIENDRAIRQRSLKLLEEVTRSNEEKQLALSEMERALQQARDTQQRLSEEIRSSEKLRASIEVEKRGLESELEIRKQRASSEGIIAKALVGIVGAIILALSILAYTKEETILYQTFTHSLQTILYTVLSGILFYIGVRGNRERDNNLSNGTHNKKPLV